MEIEDSELIDRYLRGETRAVARVDRWITSAASPFRKRLAETWDDVLQDARLEITRLLRARTFRGDSSLKTYLWRVVSHSCLDEVRARKRWRWEELESGGEELARPTAAGPLRARVDRDLLLRVLAQMTDDCKELWRMIVEGYSYREMSQRLGVAEGALRVRVLRCRRRALEVRERLLESGVGVTDREGGRQ